MDICSRSLLPVKFDNSESVRSGQVVVICTVVVSDLSKTLVLKLTMLAGSIEDLALLKKRAPTELKKVSTDLVSTVGKKPLDWGSGCRKSCWYPAMLREPQDTPSTTEPLSAF